MPKGIRILMLLFIGYNLLAQTPCSFEHYSSQNGLAQSRITTIIQDNQGCIWLGTYDGLVRFDGYEFQNFKVQSNDLGIALSNRVLRIREDKYGRLWILSPNEVYSFVPETQQFKGVDASHQFKSEAPHVQIKRTGKVWLVSKQDGCLCVKDSLFNVESYSVENGKLRSNQVNSIYEDHHANSWLLTDNGLGFIDAENTDSVQLILENTTNDVKQNSSFYCATEINSEIWFGSSKGVIWRYSKKSKTFLEFKLNVPSKIRNFYKLDKERILILTGSDGFFCYDLSNGQLKAFNSTTIKGLPSNTLDYTYVNKPNQLWFTTEYEGIYKYDFELGNLKCFTVPVGDSTINRLNNTPFIRKDNNENLWVQPRGGGFSFYNKEKDQLEPFFNASDDPEKKFSNIVYTALFDKQGILWMCTMSAGLEKISFCNPNFATVQIDPTNSNSLSNSVRAICQEKSGAVWMATKDGRLYKSDPNLQEFTNYSADGKSNTNLPWPGSIYSILEDSNGRIWLGTKGAGLYTMRLNDDAKSYTVTHYEHSEKDVTSLSNNNVYSVFEDEQKHIWIGTLGGGINLLDESDPSKVHFIHHSNGLEALPSDNCNRIRCITQNKNGRLFAGTSGGLIVWDAHFRTPDDIQFMHVESNLSKEEWLSYNEIMEIVSTPEGAMYIATFGGGLNKIVAYDDLGLPIQFKSYTKSDGLPSDLIKGMCAEMNGDVWMSTENNLVRFNPEKESFETFHEANQLLSGAVYTESTSAHLLNNTIVFGYSDGFIRCSPEMIDANHYTPNIILSNFNVFNKPLKKSNGIPYYGSINQQESVKLTHNQNFFSIEFLALDFINTKNIQYAYKLEGVDQEWNYTNKQRVANYTNISGGEYVFKVRSTNSNGIWVDNDRSLIIIVSPPFWKTPLAYAIYLVIMLIIFLLIQKYTLIVYKLKSDVQSQKEISDVKLKFFTDISHEIRTPLTLITSPIDYLINDNRTPEDVKKQLNYISQNTNRLLKLVNQILDFRRFQSQKLKIVETNLGSFTEKICLEFMEMAEEKELDFMFQDLSGKAIIWADQDALEKIVMNLLSNAFKYNRAGDSIKVTVSGNAKNVTLKVSDNGPGISKSKQKDLFVRFATFHEESTNPSTGLGLSIIKDIADKHSAKVIVESAEGEGAAFIVHFLTGYAHFNEDEVDIVVGKPSPNEAVAMLEPIPKDKSEEVVEIVSNEKPSVLIVEDDKDLRSFILTILDQDYTVYEAEDGEDGLRKALELSPDFIVSDIMMPKMDGIELLKHLRNDTATSHIPIILLTAKTTIESKLDGLTYGADDYITKPFSVTYFKARIVNLIQQRKRLHSIYSSDINLLPQENHVMPNLISSRDEVLMEDVIKCIHQNIDDGTFSVEELALQVGLSRSTFFNKLKSLTGMSPVEFVRDVRIKHAAHLIKTERLLIKEVCYMTGFSDIKYFGKCFKTKYGMTPVQYRNGK